MRPELMLGSTSKFPHTCLQLLRKDKWFPQLCECQRKGGTSQLPGTALILTVSLTPKLHSQGQHLPDTCYICQVWSRSHHPTQKKELELEFFWDNSLPMSTQGTLTRKLSSRRRRSVSLEGKRLIKYFSRQKDSIASRGLALPIPTNHQKSCDCEAVCLVFK